MDTGLCFPESRETLLAQQQQLLAGRRPAQMFPVGTDELPLPPDFERHQNDRGIFHFRYLLPETIDRLSREGRENEILLLGPYSKPEIIRRVSDGESYCCLTEHRPDGVELRTTVGSTSTVREQVAYFRSTMDDEANILVIGDVMSVIARRKSCGAA